MREYGVIIADPPWNYSNTGTEGAAEKHYSTMSPEEICNIPVSSWAHENCILLLWTTWPQLQVAFKVIEAWQFTYLTGFPWIKIHGEPQRDLWGEMIIRPQYGVGFWARGCSEMVLIARRGNVSPPNSSFMGLLSPNYYHSRKPENLYHYAETLSGPYLELFARRNREGWDSWGNEI